MNPIERLRDDLESTSDEYPMITVMRKDLEHLLRAYENLKNELEDSKKSEG
ncbi:hypothetical protein ACNOIU_16075 (plasmid) [Exiguobacterium mexicanum]|uniref:hypothetical protein n=1 Tax=Exiguobacterium mexicanum TaxID=340146 RepID=UPI003AB52B23